jgi:hypothetical protein
MGLIKLVSKVLNIATQDQGVLGEIIKNPNKRTYKKYFIYVMQMKLTSDVKIGISGDVSRRRRSLEGSSGQKINICFKAAVGKSKAGRVERIAHSYFHKHRTIGEWFDIEPSDAIHFISQMIKDT